MPNIRILDKGFSVILFTRLFLYKMPVSEKREISQPKIYGIGSKVNQFIYTLVCTYMPNIRILAIAVLEIFFSQDCSNTKCLCPKMGNNSSEKIWNMFKSCLVHLNYGLYLYAKYQDPIQSSSSDILFTRLFLYKMPVSENKSNSTKNLRNTFKS